jgi:hypothetical protein
MAGDNFGRAVALTDDGHAAISGAPNHDIAGASSGAAYVYVRDTVGNDQPWRLASKLLADDAAAGDRFGYAVGAGGSYLLVGAPNHDGACPRDHACDSGAAYVFEPTRGPEPGWRYSAQLLAPDPAKGDRFGNSLAVFGRSLLAGAPLRDAFLTPNCGEAYRARSIGGTGVWQTAEVVGQGVATDDNFGSAVDAGPAVTAVGACECGKEVSDGPGMVFVWSRELGDPVYLPMLLK